MDSAPGEPATGEPASAGGASPPRYAETPSPAEQEPTAIHRNHPHPRQRYSPTPHRSPRPFPERNRRRRNLTSIQRQHPNRSDPSPIAPAAPVTPAIPAASNPASNTRRVAWLLGAKLSLAALSNDRGGNADEVAKWFGQSQSLAKSLGTHVDPLPAATSAGPSNAGVDFVFTQGQRIGNDLATRYDASHAALFELAAKSSILIALYEPRCAGFQCPRRSDRDRRPARGPARRSLRTAGAKRPFGRTSGGRPRGGAAIEPGSRSTTQYAPHEHQPLGWCPRSAPA